MRYMTTCDLPHVARIEALSYADPWTEDDFALAARERNVVCYVAERPGDAQPIGYAVICFERGAIRMLNLAVDPGNRRRGVGEAMVNRLVGLLKSHKKTDLVLNVSDENLAAHLFLKQVGFVAEGVRRGGPGEADQYLFRWCIPEAEPVD